MASNLLYFLLRLSISASLADRESFIKKVSNVIEDKTNTNPEAAQQISKQIASAMDGLNESLFLKQLFASQENTALNTTIKQLNSAVEKLNILLEESDLSNTSPKAMNDETP